MGKLNCWEWMHCGREPGGAREGEIGTCPTPLFTRANKVNGGYNGGRVCWAVAGNLCGGERSGSFADSVGNCIRCDFYEMVMADPACHFYGPSDLPAQAITKSG